MIISPKHRFVFVHIPKCAGTSVRHQLRDCDPDHIFLGRPGDHPELGRIDYAHLTIAQLKAHFQQEYTALRDFDGFALVRDPLPRFGSALRQLLWQYEERPMTLIPPGELREMVLTRLEEIAEQIDEPSFKYVFFTRQCDYIFDGDEALVDHVIPTTLVPDLLDYFSKRTGVALDRERRSNQNVELRFKGIGGLAYGANRLARRVLPLELHSRLKNLAIGLVAKKESAAQASGLLDLPEVRAFVDEHYARDQDLYRAVMAQEERLRKDLRSGQLSAALPEGAA